MTEQVEHASRPEYRLTQLETTARWSVALSP